MHLSHAPASLFSLVTNEGGLDELANLTQNQKADLWKKLGVVQAVQNAAYGTKQAVVAASARAQVVSEQAIHTWCQQYRKYGFRGLIDGRKAAAKGRADLPDVTKGWITASILRAQRNDAVREVRRQALDQWNRWRRTGDTKCAIPGYLTPPADCGKGYPAGWSYENFRRCRPDGYQAALARQGRIAADRLLPSILGTRVGCAYLEVVYFDDQKYDHYNISRGGYDRPMVPLGFNAIDKLSAVAFQPHIRLRWRDEEANQYRTLTGREFVWYAITRLCTEGYRDDEIGTTYVKEHGTANVWSNQSLSTVMGFHSFEDAIKSLLNGRVRLDDSGLYNKPVFNEMLFGPQSAGNPRFKAPIESFFHLVRNYHLALPGQTGRNVDEAPEESYGLINYERKMEQLARSLPDQYRAAIKSNLYSFEEFAQLSCWIYDGLNARTDHAIQGWEDCGFFEIRWRWAEDPVGLWRSRDELAAFADHAPHLLAHHEAQFARDSSLRRSFRLSPAEAHAKVCHDPAIKRMRFEDAIFLVPLEWAQPVRIRDKREIRIKDALLGSEELIYFTEVTNRQGRTEYLSPGDEVLAFLNPFDLDRLLICDQQGRYIGYVVRSIRVGRDRETVQAMFQERSRMRGNLDAVVRHAMAPVADERQEIKDHNAAVRSEAEEAGVLTPPSPTAKQARATEIKREASKVSFGRAVAASRPQDACMDDAAAAEDWTDVAAPSSPESSQTETESW